MKPETKQAIREEGELLLKHILGQMVVSAERIITLLTVDTDNKLDDALIPLVNKLKNELLEIIEKA